ncbi:MAG: hypothetical protein J6Y01_05005, partial [Spirochaetales bacterium]|nr:hypothetical protein [Spirochaetales bacterium]
ECIDYFIEWYKQSDYKDPNSLVMIQGFENALSHQGLQTVLGGKSTIGAVLKDPNIWEKSAAISTTCQMFHLPDISPSHIVESIMSEWDKTLTQTDMAQVTIYVPADSVNAYKAAAGWSRYADNIKPITEKAASFEAAVNAE